MNKSQEIPLKGERNSTSSADWSEHDSSSSFSSRSSYTDSDDSYIPDWEPFVTYDGQLFYLELNSMPQIPAKEQQNIVNTLASVRNAFGRVSTRRSNRSSGISKLSKLISRRAKLPIPQGSTSSGGGDSKVTFRETSTGQIKELTVTIDPARRHKFGRRTTISESLLGIATCPFPDGERVMVAGFSSILQSVKVGDWIKKIDEEEVNVANWDTLLLTYETPTDVVLTLQQTADEKPIEMPEDNLSKFFNFSMVANNLELLFPGNISTEDECFALLYLTMNGEKGPLNQDTLFCFPEKEKNSFYATRGSFLTLNSLLAADFHANPQVTILDINGRAFHVVYTPFNEDLLILALASEFGTQEESLFLTREICRALEFAYRVLPCAFAESNMNHLRDLCQIIDWSIRLRRSRGDSFAFEEILREVHLVPLPKEAQLRIDDALSEMEAMDYREWNYEPLKSHREFYIVGSALFFKNFLLATHLPVADLIDLNAFLRLHGIPRLLAEQNVKDFVLWKEVFLRSCDRGLTSNGKIYGIPTGRWFLNIIARGQMAIAVILELRYVDANQTTQFIPPSPFYVEEIQDTLEHLRTGGVETLANTWIASNRRPQCVTNVLRDDAASQSGTLQTKKMELISILKRKSTSSENVDVSSSHTPSEDSHKRDDDESDSDWDGFPDSQKSSSGFDMSETETLLKEVSDIIPSRLTSGHTNVLLHYVQLEIGEGILLAPTNTTNVDLIRTFRQTCFLIHTVLQNTIRFRQLLAQETSKPNSHRSLVAIKEHGVLLRMKSTDFWVIGRLFLATGRETYLCHVADVPQNLVEIAFRLTLNAAG
ncbi:protein inturned [Lutzomyia longipalpis]|uniref:protein inturned n=1 Tax=Lutzomyia longipalpis TaxID=7200 RepID=UPI0024844219|nr:protein inturned [Lutzomyia longipalpis]